MAIISPWQKVPRTPNTHLHKERFVFFSLVFVVFQSNNTCWRKELKCKGKISAVAKPYCLRRTCPTCTYINKEKLKMVVREPLARMQRNCRKTSTALWTPYRRVSLKGWHMQICFSCGVCGEKTEMIVCHFGFTEKIYVLSCTVHMSTMQDNLTCKKLQDPLMQASLDSACVHARERLPQVQL